MKILLVEDSKVVLTMVKDMLVNANFEVFEAFDGKEAVSFLKSGNTVDLILLDWNMPNMNGVEFLIFNSENKITDANIVMMTTENKPERIMEALELGASEYLMKPFTSDILLTKIEAL